jgi:hypothetical protein
MWQIAIMTKTQVSIPDELYEKARAIAKAKEWSLAEVFRRGLEHMAMVHKAAIAPVEWEFPEIALGKGAAMNSRQILEIAQEDAESFLVEKIEPSV